MDIEKMNLEIQDLFWRVQQIQDYLISIHYENYVCKYKSLCSNDLNCNKCKHKPDFIFLNRGVVEKYNFYSIDYVKKILDEFLEKPNSKEELQ